MLARREQIVAEMLVRLTAACPDIAVTRNRRSQLPETEAPALNLLDGGHTTQYDSGDVIYTMRVDIDGTVTAGTDAEIGAALNALYTQALRAFLDDLTLGGLCSDVCEETLDVRVAPTVEAANPLADFTLGLQVEFRTPDGDPTG